MPVPPLNLELVFQFTGLLQNGPYIVSAIPDLDNVGVEIWDFGFFCNRMRLLEMLG